MTSTQKFHKWVGEEWDAEGPVLTPDSSLNY